MGWLESIGTIFSLISQIIKDLKMAFGLIKQAKDEGWYEEGKELAKKIRDAQTDEERRALLNALSKHDSN